MTDSVHQQLIGSVLGALDDDEQSWFDARLEEDEDCRRELTGWRRRLAPLEAIRPEYEPPPGLARRTCRMVAAYGPPAKARPRETMSPDPAHPALDSRFTWHDAAAIGVLTFAALALLLPAIDASRFRASVVACQDNLRRFGAAMAQYGDSHGQRMDQLAEEGGLTPAGLAAADLVNRATGPRNLCPRAWLAAQNAAGFHWAIPYDFGDVPPSPGTGFPGHFYFSTANAPPGDWRDGTMGDPSPTALPLLADDPSAALPGHRLVGHRGRGRNLYFEDGRVCFVPRASTAETLDDYFSRERYRDSSTPVIYVNRK